MSVAEKRKNAPTGRVGREQSTERGVIAGGCRSRRKVTRARIATLVLVCRISPPASGAGMGGFTCGAPARTSPRRRARGDHPSPCVAPTRPESACQSSGPRYEFWRAPPLGSGCSSTIVEGRDASALSDLQVCVCKHRLVHCRGGQDRHRAILLEDGPGGTASLGCSTGAPSGSGGRRERPGGIAR